MKHWANYNGTGYQRAYSFKTYSLGEAISEDGYNQIFKDLYEGDIIQYKGTGGLDHSQVVHGYDSNDLYMAQHGTTEGRFWSGEKLKTYLTWIFESQEYTNVTVYTIRMKLAPI